PASAYRSAKAVGELPHKHHSMRRLTPEEVMIDKHTAVGRLDYRPAPRDEVQQRFTDTDGVKHLNSYRPSLLVPKYGDVALWLDHIRYIFNGRDEEMNHFLDVLAFKAQHPGAKIRHALCIGGVPGLGKDTMLRPLKAIFGPHNFVEPRNEEI